MLQGNKTAGRRDWYSAVAAVWVVAFACTYFGLHALTTRPSGEAEPALIERRCGACHEQDVGTGRRHRIYGLRKTPEGWQQSIRRMRRLYELQLEPEEQRAIVAYLADTQGLSPSELEPVVYGLERRPDFYEDVKDADIREACVRCHSFARFGAQRRSPEEWRKLKALHMAEFPSAVYVLRNIDWPTRADRALDKLAALYPLDSAAWEARRLKPAATLAQAWGVSGYWPGRGRFWGTAQISKSGNDYQVRERWSFEGGEALSLNGTGLLYTGFAWRATVESPDGKRFREVLHSFSEGSFRGRVFEADHDELGADVRWVSNSALMIASPRALRRGQEKRVQFIGSRLPRTASIGELRCGSGVEITHVVVDAEGFSATVNVAPDAALGERDCELGGVRGERLLTVYDRVDYIKVLPERAMARIGGLKAPKQYEQLEAWAFSNGNDGRPGSADDLRLFPVAATWHLEKDESSGEDDVPFVGNINAHGLFTPAADGPNPKRHGSYSNTGSVWLVAQFSPPGSRTPLRARARLRVTAPLYIRWEIP